jgi:hypothetical protein
MQSQGGKAADVTRSIPSANGTGVAARTAMQPSNPARRLERPVVSTPEDPIEKPIGYGLPCAKCRTYYSAQLDACPVCKSAERVSGRKEGDVSAAPVPQPDGEVLDAERERFLREFKAKLYAAHMQINPTAETACVLAGDGDGAGHERASVCKDCYDRLRERADLAEAALHMDLKEATQIIYEAVWADPTDSTKTYRNAAMALLNELRRRAGIASVLGPLQRLTH